MSKLVFRPRAEAIRRMNRWGSERREFFFLIDFDEAHCLVEPLEEIPADELRYVSPVVRIPMNRSCRCVTPSYGKHFRSRLKPTVARSMW